MDDPRWHADVERAPAAPKLRDLAPNDADDPVSDHGCPHCDGRFARRHWLAMHIARDHVREMTTDDAAMVGTAEAREEAYFVRLRKHVRGSLVIAPWILLYFYGIILLIQGGNNPAMAFVPAPGVFGFLALIYFMVFTKDDGPKRGGPPSE